jgi:hypothetical protein
MPVGELPNDGYTFRSIAADLEQIRKSNGYWTDVESVVKSDYEPSDEGHWLMVDQASIHIWLDKDFQDSGRESTGDYSPVMRVATRAVVKVDAEVWAALIKLKTDLRRVMISNASREFPGLTTDNRWAYYTEQARGKPIEYFYHPDKTGSILGFWDVFYYSPSPAG